MSKPAKSPKLAPPDPLARASDAARALGHTPLRDRHDWACWICDCTGKVNGDRFAGDIFEEKCR